MTTEIKEDKRSLNRPGWNSFRTCILSEDSESLITPNLEGKFAQIITHRALYARAQILKVNRESFFVRFVKKSIPDKENPGNLIPQKETDCIQKKDVQGIQVYED